MGSAPAATSAPPPLGNATATATTCVGTRIRYGANCCDSTHLRVDDVEARVFEDILERYLKTDLLLHATQTQGGQLAQHLAQRRGELRAIKSEIAATETANERYIDAFERGTKPKPYAPAKPNCNT